LWFIIESARPLKMHPDVFRSKVCDAINAEMASDDAIRKYEDKNGEGSWLRGVSQALESWVGAITINKA
jgi:hypothetical protein